VAGSRNGKHYFMHIATGRKDAWNQGLVQNFPIDPSCLHRLFTGLSTIADTRQNRLAALQICDR